MNEQDRDFAPKILSAKFLKSELYDRSLPPSHTHSQSNMLFRYPQVREYRSHRSLILFDTDT